MALRNLTRDVVIAERPEVAVSFGQRARGMIGRRFGAFDAMILPACGAVHTFFMTQALDLIFVDNSGRVLALRADVPPWRALISGPGGTATTIELPAGSLQKIRVEVSDQLCWS
jgi:uncharacterized membrane protein (UPF0127 family)